MGGVLPSAAMTALQMGLETAQQRTQAQAQKADARRQAEQVRLTQEANERQRRDRLRRVLATQRARFASQGIGEGGSAQAVLGGLASEAERENAEGRALASSRISRINDELEWSRRRSLLEASRPANRLAFGLVQRGFRTLPLLEL